MTGNGHDITMPARLGSQHAKPFSTLWYVTRSTRPAKNLLRLILVRVFHTLKSRQAGPNVGVSATVSFLRIPAVSAWALMVTRQCFCAVLWPTFRLLASGVRELSSRASRSCDSRPKSIATASLAGNVCSSASSSSPSRWASALEDALCGLFSIGMPCKTFFNSI